MRAALRTLPPLAIGAGAAAMAVALSSLPLKFAVVGLVAPLGGLGALLLGQRVRLTPFLLAAFAVGLTVKLDVSMFQHFEAVGQYLPSIGGGAGLTISVAFLVALTLIAFRLLGIGEAGPQRLSLDPPLVLTQLAFMAAGVLSLANAGDRLYLWFDEWRFLTLLVVSVAIANLGPRDVRTLAVAICVLCLVQTAAAAVQYVTGSELGLGVLGEEQIVEENINFQAQRRAAGFKVHPNILGYYYEVVWPLALALALSRGPAWLRLVGALGALSALVGVVLTLSRASWLTYPLSATLVVLLVYRDRLLSRASLIAAGLLLVAAVIAAIVVGPMIGERLFADDGGSAAQRGPLNAAALALFSQFPILGVGLNNFGNMFATLDQTGLSRLAGLFDRSNHVVHNLHILVLTEVGVVGYAAFAAVFATGLWRGFAAIRRAPVGDPLAAIAGAAAIGLLAHLLHGLVDPGFRLNLGIAELLYTALGMIAAVAAAQRASRLASAAASSASLLSHRSRACPRSAAGSSESGEPDLDGERESRGAAPRPTRTKKRDPAMTPALSVLIVTYRSGADIDTCLTLLAASRIDRAYEVIVVDNASGDGTAERIAARWPDVRLIAETRNHGFAGANAIAYAAARGAAILLLNPDAYLRDPEAVSAALAHLDAHRQVGAVGLRLVFEDGRHQVGDAGFEPRPLTVAVHAAGLSGRFGLRGVYLSDGQARAPGPVSVDWLCGAFLMLRREAVEAIGGLSSPLFLYGEDVDWGCRVRDAGWLVDYLPDRSVVHLQGGSGSTRSARWLDGLAGVYRLRNAHRRLSAQAFFAVPLWLGFTARAAAYGLLGRLRRRPDLLGKSRDMKRFAAHLSGKSTVNFP